MELHHFSDCSNIGYAQCSYVRLTENYDNVHCSFLMGKARVTPIKPVKIPRLELTAALVSAKISKMLQRELKYDNVTNIFWTDSRIVLGYIKNEARRFHVFEVSQWRHVTFADNPADCSSRGLSPAELTDHCTWLQGPDFLRNNKLPSDDAHADYTLHPVLAYLESVSDWHPAKRVIAVWLLWKQKLRNAIEQTHPASVKITQRHVLVDTATLQNAEFEIVRNVQAECFSEEIKILRYLKSKSSSVDGTTARQRNKYLKGTSSLYRLDPFLDDQGIMRVGGRIRRVANNPSFNHPMILPRKHHITNRIIRHFHKHVQHQGRGMATNEVRSNGFWIVGCSFAVAHHIKQCVLCRKLRRGVLHQKTCQKIDLNLLHPLPTAAWTSLVHGQSKKAGKN